MRVLVLYDYPPPPGGLATQGDLLYRGLLKVGIEAQAAPLDGVQEKEWYFHWFKPDVVVGVGFWGYLPLIISRSKRHNIPSIPWLVADGYVANYKNVLNKLPLILVTSNWVKDVYVRDGINPDIIEVLPVGCDTDSFVPRSHDHPYVLSIRKILRIYEDQLVILTIGGDAASKGAREVMRALAKIGPEAPDWKYICKVWPQKRTFRQNFYDMKLAKELKINRKVHFMVSKMSRNMMPYLINSCDIYAGPSRLEGFGMPHVEASACGKPVIAVNEMGFLDTLVHGQTAYLAGISKENVIQTTVLGKAAGYKEGHQYIFEKPCVADYRAKVDDVANYLLKLMIDPRKRAKMGKAGRKYVKEKFDYRVVAGQFVDIIKRRLDM